MGGQPGCSSFLTTSDGMIVWYDPGSAELRVGDAHLCAERVASG